MVQRPCRHENEARAAAGEALKTREPLQVVNETLIPALDEAALSACLAEYESGFLYQKTGYILSAFAASLGLSDSFFAMCKSHLPKGKSYLSSESQGFIWHEEWKLYAPKNLMHMIDKGVTDYDAI